MPFAVFASAYGFYRTSSCRRRASTWGRPFRDAGTARTRWITDRELLGLPDAQGRIYFSILADPLGTLTITGHPERCLDGHRGCRPLPHFSIAQAELVKAVEEKIAT